MGSNYSRLRQEVICELQNETGYTENQIKSFYKYFTEKYPYGFISLIEFKDFADKLLNKPAILTFCLHVLSKKAIKDSEVMLDFREFLCAVHAVDHTEPRDRLLWAFNTMDSEEEGIISDEQAKHIIAAIHMIKEDADGILPPTDKTLEDIRESTSTKGTKFHERDNFVNGALGIEYLCELLLDENKNNLQRVNLSTTENSEATETSFMYERETPSNSTSSTNGAVGGCAAAKDTLAVDVDMCQQADTHYIKTYGASAFA